MPVICVAIDSCRLNCETERFALFRKTARDALVRLVPDILPSVEICSGHDCSRLLWAYRRAEIPAARCQELLSAVIMRCARLNAELSARDCATVLWAAGHYRALHDFPILPTCEIAKVFSSFDALSSSCC